MPFSENEPTFARLGEEQAIRVVTMLARIVHQSPLVDFDLDAVGDAQRNLLFELSFFAIAAFEERSGIEVVGQTYFPRLTFQIGTSGPEPDLIFGNTQIHGLVEDPVLDAGIERAHR